MCGPLTNVMSTVAHLEHLSFTPPMLSVPQGPDPTAHIQHSSHVESRAPVPFATWSSNSRHLPRKFHCGLASRDALQAYIDTGLEPDATDDAIQRYCLTVGMTIADIHASFQLEEGQPCPPDLPPHFVNQTLWGFHHLRHILTTCENQNTVSISRSLSDEALSCH